MESESNTIKCPSCGFEINVSDVLFHQVQEQLKKEYEAKGAAKDKEFKSREQKLQQEKEALLKAQESMQEQVNAAVKQKLSVEKASMEQLLRKQIEDEKSEQVKSLETELNTKSDQLKEFNKTKALVSQLQREKGEIKELVEAESQVKFDEQLVIIKEKIQATEAEKSQSRIQLKDKLISDLTKKVEEVTLRLEQNSNKQVGEIAEIVLRDFLKTEFPFDIVEDVASGIRGADVVQTVRNSIGIASGKILYERKQTLNFSESWISKLQEDGRTVKANALVLVTQSMPKDKPESHLRDGVWVCSFEDLKIIVSLLRDGTIKTSAALSSQQNKGTKMELLYEYLVSSEFAGQITALLESFRKMEKSLAKEKEDAFKKFAERDAHIWQAKKAILGFYGKIDGIAADGMSQLTEQVMMLVEPPQQLES